MTRNVRNFWIEGEIDGRASSITGGPQSREGGFGLRIYQRDGGRIIKTLTLHGYADRYGKLALWGWTDPNGDPVIKVETER